MTDSHRRENVGGMPMPRGATLAAGAGAVLLAIPVMYGLGKLLGWVFTPVARLLGWLFDRAQAGYRALFEAWDAGVDVPGLRVQFVVGVAVAAAASTAGGVAASRGLTPWVALLGGLAVSGAGLILAARVRGRRRRMVVFHKPGDRDWLAIAFSLSSAFTNVVDRPAPRPREADAPPPIRGGAMLPPAE